MTRATVVVPTHNRRKLLLQTLRSVLWQRDVDFECIVVDDGSTDDTASVVEGLGDPRIRVVRHETSRGVGAARNRGIDEARGEWIAFLDDDDLWAPNKLHLQLEAAHNSDRQWVYAGAVNVDHKLQVHGGAPPPSPEETMERIGRYNVVPAGSSNVVVHRGAVAIAGGFDVGYPHFADWDMWIRLATVGPPAWVPLPLVGYRFHPGARSLDTHGMAAEFESLRHRYGDGLDPARFYRYLSRLCLRQGRRADAVRYMARAAVLGGPPRRWGLYGDLRVLLEHSQQTLGRRWPAAGWGLRRHRRAAARDPNRAWKAGARAWLGELRLE